MIEGVNAVASGHRKLQPDPFHLAQTGILARSVVALDRARAGRTAMKPGSALYARHHWLTHAQVRVPIEVTRSGFAVNQFQAVQHASTMSS